MLTQEQINGLLASTIKAANFIDGINNEIPHRYKIKQVQMPEILSKSIVYHTLANKLREMEVEISEEYLYFGKKPEHDIVVNFNNIRINIEVKSTGANTKQSFSTNRALNSDQTWWVDFYGFREIERSVNYRIYKFPTEIIPRPINPNVSLSYFSTEQIDSIYLLNENGFVLE